jgi:hypothetical protein
MFLAKDEYPLIIVFKGKYPFKWIYPFELGYPFQRRGTSIPLKKENFSLHLLHNLGSFRLCLHRRPGLCLGQSRYWPLATSPGCIPVSRRPTWAASESRPTTYCQTTTTKTSFIGELSIAGGHQFIPCWRRSPSQCGTNFYGTTGGGGGKPIL